MLTILALLQSQQMDIHPGKRHIQHTNPDRSFAFRIVGLFHRDEWHHMDNNLRNCHNRCTFQNQSWTSLCLIPKNSDIFRKLAYYTVTSPYRHHELYFKLKRNPDSLGSGFLFSLVSLPNSVLWFYSNTTFESSSFSCTPPESLIIKRTSFSESAYCKALW